MEEIIKQLKTNNISKIKNLITKLDLDNMKFIERTVLLEKLLQAAKIDDPDFEKLSIITEKWLGNLETGDLDGFIGDLCGLISISIDSIVYVMMGCEDISTEEILTIILESKQNYFNFNLTATRLQEAFKIYINKQTLSGSEYELQNDAWNRLLDIATNNNKKDAIVYINSKLNLLTQVANKPKYMKTECKKVVEINETNVRQKATQITKSLFKKTENVDDKLMEQVDEYIEGFTELDCINIVSFLEKEKNYIDDFDMLEGPLNSIVYEKINSLTHEKEIITHQCLGASENRNNKGCRMLTCTCINLDFDDDSEVLPLQWYKGKCDLCKKRILKVCYAFRLPLDAGGWIGCYCNPECAMLDANEYIKKGLKGEETFEKFHRFNEIEALVLLKGIVDRDII